MATTNVTISVDQGILDDVRAAATTVGLSLSAWLARAAQRQLLRESYEAHARWTAAHPLEAERATLEARMDELDREAARVAEELGQIGEAA